MQHNSLTNNDLNTQYDIRNTQYEPAYRLSTKDFVRNFTLFMQNKPNFQKSQMNVNNVSIMSYVNWTLGYRGKNKPKTNPIQSQFKPNPQNTKIKLSHYLKRTYSNFHYFKLFKNKPNQTQYKPNPTIMEKNLCQFKKPTKRPKPPVE